MLDSDKTDHIKLLYWMMLTRAVDDRTISLAKLGKIPGTIFSQKGHEAISVGAACALSKVDIVAPMHRDLGAYLVRGMTPGRIFSQAMARATSPSQGRDVNTHGMGDIDLGIIGYVSHLPQSMTVALGAAFSFQYRKEPRVALTFTGDGASSEGAFSESLNLAAVLKLPIVFILEDNQYAYSTPSKYQYAITDLVARATAFGLPGITVAGNNVLDVRSTTIKAIDRARNGDGPTLIKANTMRMEGHALHDSAEYVPKELLDEWKVKDPIENYKTMLYEKGILNKQTEKILKEQINKEVSDGEQWAENSPYPDPSTLTEGVYA